MLTHKRILVVEDEPLLAMVISDTLLNAGAVVLGPVGTVSEAISMLNSALQNGGIDAAVLDVNLHGEMVWPVADALSESHVPYVVQTAYAYADLDKQPTTPVLNKPYRPGAILDAVEAITDKQGACISLSTSVG